MLSKLRSRLLANFHVLVDLHEWNADRQKVMLSDLGLYEAP
jgi:hypothetical protein